MNYRGRKSEKIETNTVVPDSMNEVWVHYKYFIINFRASISICFLIAKGYDFNQ